jgi:serine/threonine protein kinase
MLASGTVLDRKYEIRGRLGTGGMGEVYRAHRLLLGDDVAVKIISAVARDPDMLRERFLRESRANAQLRHPNIVSVLDFNIDGEGRPYLVMEYLNGPSLAEELRARGRFDLATFRHILAPICSALQLAHERGVVHRDLKPSNIVSHRFDTGEAIWKIIDFGLVNIADPEETRLTAAHEFLGTAAYAAPEQLNGEPLDGRTDLYSLGVIAFELLAGRPPFTGDSVMALLDRQLNAPPPDLAELRPDIPPEVPRAIARALAKKPDDRWPGTAAFSRALLEEAEPTVAVPQGAPSGLLATYQLGPVIGRGRFGSEIHEGLHRALGHPVAIRTFRAGDSANRDAVRARFLQEARALQVPHPNIVQVRDFGENGDVLYVVTDLLSGCSLAELIAAGPLSLERLHAFVAQLADATVAVHRRGGLICGLHPEIIRIVRDAQGERLAISSAGICTIRDLLSTLEERTLRGQDAAETELPYVAPELLMGRSATHVADVFTIGVLAYEMATTRVPFSASSLPELLGVMLGSRPEAPDRLRPDLHPRRAAIIMKALEADPAARFDDVSMLLEEWKALTIDD